MKIRLALILLGAFSLAAFAGLITSPTPSTGSGTGGGGTNSYPIAVTLTDLTNAQISCVCPTGVATNSPLHFRITMSTNVTVLNPTGMGDGQRILVEFIQDATGSRTVTFGSDFAFGTDITGITLTTNASKRDFATFVRDDGNDKWYAVGFVQGY